MKKLAGTSIYVYRGVYVLPADSNSSGIRYWAIGPSSFLRASSLTGMRSLIRSARGVQS